MSLIDIIPMCSDKMSSTTVCVVAICVSAFLFFATIYTRYNSNEFRRVEKWVLHDLTKLELAIGEHDDYIDATNAIINQIHIDLAVQEASMKTLVVDIAEIKADIKTLLKR